jgi:hypothetical protein
MDPENPPPPSGSPTAADLCRPQRIGSPTRPKFRTCDTVLKNTEEMAQAGTPLPADREIDSANNILFIKNVVLLFQ